MTERDRSLDVAVTGMFARFPETADLDAWWAAMRSGRTLTRRLDREWLRAEGVPAATLADPDYVPVRGFLPDADRFDHALFGISPREAELMDPQHRLMLEAAWSALEDAGHDPTEDRLRTGVYASASDSTYLLRALSNGPVSPETLELLLLGAGRDHMAGRIAYRLGLTGPAVGVLTACSSSLVAVHLAAQALLAGDCDQAVVVAASVAVPQEGHTHVRGGIYSASGACRPFDADSDGAVAGSGVVAVVLRRLADVEADDIRPHGVILGSAINNDGAAKAGYNAPSPPGQEAVILAALRAADVPATSLGYLEAHATGTYVGDPIEWTAASAAYRRHGVAAGAIAVGAVKANMGHLDAAAGLAALVKALHVVRDGVIPPVAGFRTLNPMLTGGALTVPGEPTDWSGPLPRRAGISSFGIGGTNAHVIVEQAGRQAVAPHTERETLLVLSAADEAALHRSAARLAEHLTRHPTAPADAARTLSSGRAMLGHRLAVVGRSREELADRLTTGAVAGTSQGQEPLVFLLPGQGLQWPGMALPFLAVPGFDAALDDCLTALAGAGVAAGEVREALLDSGFPTARLEETELAQPAIFALQHAASTALRGIGLAPAVFAGHSLGELTAACLAGVLDLTTAARTVAVRARAMQACSPGAMLALACGEDEASALLIGTALEIAAVNGPDNCVVAGPAAAVEALRQRVRVPAVRLRTSRAFHTALVEPAVAELRATLATAIAGRQVTPFLVNATGTFASAPFDLDLLATGVRAAVRFGDGMAAVAARHPNALAVEIGPGRALSTTAIAAGLAAVPLAPRRDTASLLLALGELWTRGQPVALTELGDPRARRVHLPTYPFHGPRLATPFAEVAPPGMRTVVPADVPAPRPVSVHDAVAIMWRDLLGHHDLRDDADFFALGGDSLVVIRLARRIAAELGVEVPIRDLVAVRTLGGHLALVARLVAEGDQSEMAA